MPFTFGRSSIQNPQSNNFMSAPTDTGFVIPDHIKLSKNDIELLDTFFSLIPPDAFLEDIMEVYHTYMIHNSETLPLNFRNLAMNMYNFINALIRWRRKWSGLNQTEVINGQIRQGSDNV
jgi:hypothetical protein